MFQQFIYGVLIFVSAVGSIGLPYFFRRLEVLGYLPTPKAIFAIMISGFLFSISLLLLLRTVAVFAGEPFWPLIGFIVCFAVGQQNLPETNHVWRLKK